MKNIKKWLVIFIAGVQLMGATHHSQASTFAQFLQQTGAANLNFTGGNSGTLFTTSDPVFFQFSSGSGFTLTQPRLLGQSISAALTFSATANGSSVFLASGTAIQQFQNTNFSFVTTVDQIVNGVLIPAATVLLSATNTALLPPVAAVLSGSAQSSTFSASVGTFPNNIVYNSAYINFAGSTNPGFSYSMTPGLTTSGAFMALAVNSFSSTATGTFTASPPAPTIHSTSRTSMYSFQFSDPTFADAQEQVSILQVLVPDAPGLALSQNFTAFASMQDPFASSRGGITVTSYGLTSTQLSASVYSESGAPGTLLFGAVADIGTTFAQTNFIRGLYNGVYGLEYNGGGFGGVDDGDPYRIVVTLPGDRSSPGTGPGETTFVSLNALYTIDQMFHYDATTDTTRFEAHLDNYVNDGLHNPSLHFIIHSTIGLDSTAPTTTIAESGTVGNNGWYRSPVVVTLAATDPDDAPNTLTTYYQIDNAPKQTYSAPFSVSSDLKHAVLYWSQDRSGNVEKAQQALINIDSTPPTLAWGTQSPAATGSAWNNSSVNLTYTASDNLSGVASSTPMSPLQFTVEGAGQTQTITVTDLAGNSATFVSPAVNIDLTPPTLVWSGRNTSPNDAGWNNGTVTLTYLTSDNLSGIASSSPASPIIFSSEGSGQSRTVTVSDNAGNLATFPSPVVNIDLTPPVITASANPTYLWPPNNKVSSVTVTGKITDALSGVKPTSARFRVVDEYNNWLPTGPVAVDAGGNYSVQVPLLSALNSTDPDGRHYTVIVEASDYAGNMGAGSTTVFVPVQRGPFVTVSNVKVQRTGTHSIWIQTGHFPWQGYYQYFYDYIATATLANAGSEALSYLAVTNASLKGLSPQSPSIPFVIGPLAIGDSRNLTFAYGFTQLSPGSTAQLDLEVSYPGGQLSNKTSAQLP